MSVVDKTTQRADELRSQITRVEAELAKLKEQLAKLGAGPGEGPATKPDSTPPSDWKWPLSQAEYDRYGRQLLIPSVGVQGQVRLRRSSALIIGAGGLGCPAAAYLAGAGVGRIGICDGDVVETSNLHRQIGHATERVGRPKVESLVEFLKGLNPTITYTPHSYHLTPSNAASTINTYDIVLDCTDHPAVRYLISDACVLLGKPLVSASALRTDAQLLVLNNPPSQRAQTDTLHTAEASGYTTEETSGAQQRASAEAGPCYRCVFPKPPPPEAVVSCGEGGILGPVVGAAGVLQALEALRLLTSSRVTTPLSEQQQQQQQQGPSMLLFSATSAGPSFRTVRLMGKRRNCVACGDAASLTLEGPAGGQVDYVAFCGTAQPVELLQDVERVSVSKYVADVKTIGHLLLDVREKELFDMGSIEGAVNVPFSKFQAKRWVKADGLQEGQSPLPDGFPAQLSENSPIYVVCRVGNDSQLVTRRLKEIGLDRNGERFIGDIKGGMLAWKAQVDDTMPFM